MPRLWPVGPAFVFLAACSGDTPVDSSALSAAIATPHVFESAEVRLRGSAFVAAYGALVKVGDSTLQQRRIDDSTVGVVPPYLVGASVAGPIVVEILGVTRDLGTVELYGFREHFTGPSITGYPAVFGGANPSFVADGESTLIRYWPATRVTQDLGVRFGRTCSYGPGPSGTDAVVTTTTDCAASLVVQFTPTVTADSAPFLMVSSVRARLAGGSFLSTSNHNDALRRPDGTIQQFQAEGTATFRLSVDGRVAAPLGGWRLAGLVAYHDSGVAFARAMTSSVLIHSSAFSASGDTLWVLAQTNWPQAVLYRLNSAGQVFDSLALAVRAGDLALDPSMPLVYVFDHDETTFSNDVVLVIDTRAMALVARLHTPGGFSGPSGAQVVVDPAGRNLFAFGRGQRNSAGTHVPAVVPVARFALPPAGSLP